MELIVLVPAGAPEPGGRGAGQEWRDLRPPGACSQGCWHRRRVAPHPAGLLSAPGWLPGSKDLGAEGLGLSPKLLYSFACDFQGPWSCRAAEPSDPKLLSPLVRSWKWGVRDVGFLPQTRALLQVMRAGQLDSSKWPLWVLGGGRPSFLSLAPGHSRSDRPSLLELHLASPHQLVLIFLPARLHQNAGQGSERGGGGVALRRPPPHTVISVSGKIPPPPLRVLKGLSSNHLFIAVLGRMLCGMKIQALALWLGYLESPGRHLSSVFPGAHRVRTPWVSLRLGFSGGSFLHQRYRVPPRWKFRLPYLPRGPPSASQGSQCSWQESGHPPLPSLL